MIKKIAFVRPVYFAGLFMVTMLAACGLATAAPTSQQLHIKASPDSILAASTPTPQPTVSTPAILFYFTPTPVDKIPLPSDTSQPSFQACTPLKDHTWTDLQEIVTNPFDPPPPRKDTGHQGVDFAYYRRGDRLSIEGVPVQSVLPGSTAAVVHNRPPYGNMVIIETPFALLPTSLAEFLGMTAGQSVYMLYAHMKADPLVEMYQPVVCGEQLGEVGNTPPGWSSAAHLHLEVRVGPSGKRFWSVAYYDNSITLEEKSNYELWRMSGTFRMMDPLHLLGYVLNPAN